MLIGWLTVDSFISIVYSMKTRKNIWVVSSVIAIIGGVYALCILLSDISSWQKLLLGKFDEVLEWQTEIKNELTVNNNDHKKFALWEPTIDFVIKHFNLK